MKIGEKEVEMFDENNELIINDLVQKYYAIKSQLRSGEIKAAPHDTNFIKIFKEVHKIELDIEEMLELRDFAENDYELYIKEKIQQDRISGMENIDLTGII